MFYLERVIVWHLFYGIMGAFSYISVQIRSGRSEFHKAICRFVFVPIWYSQIWLQIVHIFCYRFTELEFWCGCKKNVHLCMGLSGWGQYETFGILVDGHIWFISKYFLKINKWNLKTREKYLIIIILILFHILSEEQL